MRRWHTFAALTLLLGATFAASTGCELIVAVDRTTIPGETGGTGGAGGDASGGGANVGGNGGSGAGGTDLPIGTACNTSDQCTSGFCVDNVCCETACDATCQACSAATKGDGADGTCGNAKNGVDSHDDCDDEGADTCGLDGLCDGEGACRVYPAGSSCGAEAGCENGTQTFPDQCDGEGVCIVVGTQMCGDYNCDPAGMVCLEACTTSTDCADGSYCNAASECVPQRDQSQTCVGGAEDECTTGFCVDGYCCDTACDAECKACSSAKTGISGNGTCRNVAVNTDPDDECNGYTCSAGACRTTCANNSQCDMGYTCSSMVCEQP
ncbi:hypothetical protein [Chondromyces apiculatus]|uniref:Tryptophan synthase alpha chain n=1 Tax=Chondromyces apiculatus DSM 436 TaxID=1192034 RepID=A0A017SX29_9BACT|nr:hypothetical protein [Chondromyces apiculatus]EYF01332.1 Hypothetical protein CAP_8374 [Chondromyces apiculatus DSM 436]